ncbi:glycosyltransferase family 2 protein [Candidatus Roizmanbacteria bacterium]|nr:glycosyltransferase family 2 protein [Candidatus Roizmanbacteria bacterium]
MKNITIVTVNYNTEDDTLNFLNSLKKVKTNGFNVSVIVIDNGSKNVLKLKESENVILIRQEDNLGFTGGYNLGMKQAVNNGADYVLIINNDTIVDEDMVSNLQQILEQDKTIGAVVPKIYFAKGHEFHKDKYRKEDLGKVIWYAGGHTDWKHVRSVHRGVDEVDRGQYDTPGEIQFATGCCIMFKREVLKKIGFFDDRYFLYYEDADLSERIKKAGYKIYYAPRAILFHVNASSSGGAGKGNALQDYFITRNQMIFGMQYAPVRTKAALIRQSFNLLLKGRSEQKKAIRDYYLGKFGKGTFFDNK